MTYSCSDFVDEVLVALGVEIPEKWKNDPERQARLAIEAIDRLKRDGDNEDFPNDPGDTVDCEAARPQDRQEWRASIQSLAIESGGRAIGDLWREGKFVRKFSVQLVDRRFRLNVGSSGHKIEFLLPSDYVTLKE